MSQSLYTSMGGIAAATTELQVIANNVANINTTAFKASSVHFSDVFSTTISSGSVATANTGGTNPVQVGVGVQVSAITKDFNPGSWVSTGKDTDLMIEGNGFFTVQSTDGQIYYTRAGDFSFDEDGNLVTSDGYRVLGTSSILSTTSSESTVHVPKSIVAIVQGNTSIDAQLVPELNNLDNPITTGNFTITANGTTSYTVNLDTTDVTGTIQDLVDAINSQLGAGTGITAAAGNGRLTFTIDGATATSLAFSTPTTGASNFVTETDLSGAPLVGNVYNTKILDYTATVSQLTSAAEAISLASSTINSDGSIQATYSNGDTLSVQLSDDGTNYEFLYTTANGINITGSSLAVDPNVALPGNFVLQVATITNTDGLISVGSNLFKAGPNSGDIMYTVGGEMGAGQMESGGLESSNVDLSEELSNMILAQRAIQANSRVFTTTSNVMDTVVNMGR